MYTAKNGSLLTMCHYWNMSVVYCSVNCPNTDTSLRYYDNSFLTVYLPVQSGCTLTGLRNTPTSERPCALAFVAVNIVADYYILFGIVTPLQLQKYMCRCLRYQAI